MATEGSVPRAFTRRTVWLTTVAMLTVVGMAVALSGWANTATADSTTQVEPAAAVPAGPMQVISPDDPGSGASRAAVDYFLKIEGIEGDATAPGSEGAIQIESWSWGVSQSGSAQAGGGGGGAGKVSMQDFHFTMKANKASPKLFLGCATGQHIKKAVLTARKAGGTQEEYLVLTMSDVLISSYETGGSSGEGAPTDQVSLNFAKIEYKVGPTTVHYDVKTQKGN